MIAVSETFATNRNRSFINNQAGQILEKTENGAKQFYFYANGVGVGSSGSLAAADFDYNYTPVSQKYPAVTPGGYVVSKGDTLKSIALAVFGDSKLWYLIADANGMQSDADLVVGRNLTIPNKITKLCGVRVGPRYAVEFPNNQLEMTAGFALRCTFSGSKTHR